MPKDYYNRKSRVVPFRREVELDPTVPMHVVRRDLEATGEAIPSLMAHCRTAVLRRAAKPETDTPLFVFVLKSSNKRKCKESKQFVRNRSEPPLICWQASVTS